MAEKKEKQYVSDNTQLMTEWNHQKNSPAGFYPQNTVLSSKQKVYWICHKGHTWEASVASRYYKGAGCPICARTVRAKSRRETTVKANGSLKDNYPEIAAEWHPTKNGEITPEHISAGSSDRFWWKCGKCGKEWQTGIANRKKGTGCPVCSKLEGGRKHREYNIRTQGSLKDNYPEIALEWHPTQNGEMLPEQFASGSSEKVWWLCKECGTEWETKILNRTKGHGCPSCRNEKFATSYRKKILANAESFADMFPQIAAEWHPTKNGKLKPEEFSFGSNKMVWWQCSGGHEWKTTISARTAFNTGCSICSGRIVDRGVTDLATTHPEIAAEWHPTKNGKLKPDDFKIGSDKIVWWMCARGHEWRTNIYHRQSTGCPECIKERFTSFPEQAILFYVGQSFSNVQNRYILDNSVEIDIYIPEFSIAIEYDGSIFHNTDAGLDRDRRKYLYLHERGIYLIRIKESRDDTYMENTADCYLGYDDNKNNRNLGRILHDLSTELSRKCNREVSWDIDISRDRREIYKQYMDLEKANSIAVLFPHTLDEWDYEKNDPITPYMVTKGSEKVFWWRCSNGHEIESKVKDRVRHGCPYCSNNKLLVGFNDLETTHPHLAREWIIEKNSGVKPSEIIGGKQIAWWQCVKGHAWEASIDSRKGGNGCPYCANQKVLLGFNDLSTLNPEIAVEWNYEKNGGLLPTEVVPGSNKKVWWKCQKHGHEWEAIISSRLRGNGCPYCSNQRVWVGYNDLQTLAPQIAQEWNYEKNIGVSPTDVVVGSSKSVWWKCSLGHEWQAKIQYRTSRQPKCPQCAKEKRVNPLPQNEPPLGGDEPPPGE